MDGLNSNVITGKCSGCMAYRGKLKEAQEVASLGSEAVAHLGQEVEVLKAERGAAIERAEIAEALVARLKEAAIQPRPNGHKWCALCGMWAQKDQEIDHSRACVLADLPAAARERAEEASPRG